MAQRKPVEELRKYVRVIDDQDIRIGCGACVSVCPYQALELDENGKARLIWTCATMISVVYQYVR